MLGRKSKKGALKTTNNSAKSATAIATTIDSTSSIVDKDENDDDDDDEDDSLTLPAPVKQALQLSADDEVDIDNEDDNDRLLTLPSTGTDTGALAATTCESTTDRRDIASEVKTADIDIPSTNPLFGYYEGELYHNTHACHMLVTYLVTTSKYSLYLLTHIHLLTSAADICVWILGSFEISTAASGMMRTPESFFFCSLLKEDVLSQQQQLGTPANMRGEVTTGGVVESVSDSVCRSGVSGGDPQYTDIHVSTDDDAQSFDAYVLDGDLALLPPPPYLSTTIKRSVWNYVDCPTSASAAAATSTVAVTQPTTAPATTR